MVLRNNDSVTNFQQSDSLGGRALNELNIHLYLKCVIYKYVFFPNHTDVIECICLLNISLLKQCVNEEPGIYFRPDWWKN